ncbi:MAG: penicillin-binding protein 2 [Pseudomonadota bacterium]
MNAVERLIAKEVSPWRRWAVLSLMGLCAGAVLVRAFQLQVIEREFLTHESDKRALRTVKVPAHRGAIRDRRGEPLALSAPVDSLWTIPSELLAAPEYLTPMAKLLGVPRSELKKFLVARKDRQFVYLPEARQIDPDQARHVLSLKAPGVFTQREYRRFYPAGELSAHLVGFCDIDGRGVEGLESAQNTALSGQAGARRVVRDRQGRVIEEDADLQRAEPGQDLALSMDLRLQYLAYRELKAGVVENRAKGGLIVVADSRTGEILAMASQPGYNPNRSDERQPGRMRNRAVVDVFEPGSTVKPLLVAEALESGLYRPETRIDTGNGEMKVGSMTVHDSHPRGVIDLGGLLTHSSNVASAKIGLTLGPEAVWTAFQKFGLGDPVHSGFPGEANGVFRNYAEWGQVATATASYGYGLSVNALQLVRAYAAIANDGLMPTLTLLKRTEPAVSQRAVSMEVARDVRRLMQGVVSVEGTAIKAAVPGYQVSGKTGTVRKISSGGGYHDDRHQAVFIGFMPSDNPRLVGLVMIDEPRNKQYYGGQVAAPVFSRVMKAAVRLLQVPPSETPVEPGLQARATVSVEPKT